MDYINYKLPNLYTNRISLNNEKNNDIDNLKLSNYNKSIKNNSIRTPQNLRYTFSLKDLEKNYKTNNINSSKHLFSTLNVKDNLVEKFLHQKIKIKKYLKPIKKIKKNNSAMNIYNDKLKKNLFNEINYKENKNKKNLTYLLFKKFDRNYNINYKKISNLNKFLIKDNENDTNGNSIYVNYDEEKKDSMTCVVNKSGGEEFIKKRLTKKINENNKKDKCNNIISDFIFSKGRYESPKIKNIKRIKFIQEIVQQKNKDNINNKDYQNKNMRNIHSDKYDYILKDKIKYMENKIRYNGSDLDKMNKLIESCLTKAKQQFDVDIKNIFSENI